MVLYMPTVSFHGTWYSEIFFTLELLSTGRNFPHDVQGFNILEPCKNHSRNLYNGKLENFHQSGPDLGVDDLQLSITTGILPKKRHQSATLFHSLGVHPLLRKILDLPLTVV